MSRSAYFRYYENKTRRDPVAASLFHLAFLVSFLPVRRVERRFSDRGQISRKDGITICKRTGGVGNRSSCLRFDVSSPTPIFPFSSLHFVRFPLFLRSFPLSLSLSSSVFPFPFVFSRARTRDEIAKSDYRIEKKRIRYRARWRLVEAE